MESQPSHVDKIRAGLSKWRGAPAGLTSEVGDEFMAKLRAGNTIRMLTALCTDPEFICSYARFKKHCELNAVWGEQAWRLSRANTNRLKSVNNRLRKSTMCRAGLHPMTGDNLRYRSRGTRVCVACERAASARIPTPLSEAEKEGIKAEYLRRPTTIQRIVMGRVPGGGGKRVKPLVLAKDYYHARRTDPDFARFFTERRNEGIGVGQRARRARALATANREKAEQDAKDYFAIQAMIPRWFKEQEKFDVVNDVMMDLHAGKITRDQLHECVRFYMKEANKMFAPKFSKFGNSPLVSLDEVMFEDGSTTRRDTVSGGLWD